MAAAISAMCLVACLFLVVATWAVMKAFGLLE
jgi:hypothetical protein